METVWLCLAAFGAGAVNAVAGGGTLLTFPALAGFVPRTIASASSTVCLFPASFASVWGYRSLLPACKRWILWLAFPSLAGGALGALLVEEKSFRLVIPWLILLAALLFLLQPLIARRLKLGPSPHPQPLSQEERGGISPRTIACVVVLQFLIGVYGGYFGAGIGILMLSSLSFLGLDNIHQINALKSTLAFFMNTTAAILFMIRGMVAWEYALPMALASILGGYLGARLAQRVPAVAVRWLVIVIGFGLAVYYFVQEFGV